MMNLAQKYAQYIDEIRIKKKMTVKVLCDGICNERSYRRYLSGERDVPQDKIFEFCVNLNISPNDFYYSFFIQDRNEYLLLDSMYKAITKRDYETFNKIDKKMRNVKITDHLNNKLYRYIKLRYVIDQGKMSDMEGIEKYAEIINFPNCKDNEVFDYVDIVTLMSLNHLLTRAKKPSYEALEVLERLLTDDSILYLAYNSKYLLVTIYASISVAYFRMEDDQKAMKLTTEGINKAITHGFIYPLPNMYFIRSAIYYKDGEKKKSYIEAQKCLSSVIATENPNLYSYYLGLLRERYNEDYQVFFETYHNASFNQQKRAG